MAHPNEPSIEALKEIRARLFTSDSTDENMKKIKAVEAQLLRREAESKTDVDKNDQQE
jgi:hypothetical protein